MPGILAASHGQLPKFTPSPDFLVSLQLVYRTKYSLLIGSHALAGPDRWTQALFILPTDSLLTITERWEVRKIENVSSSFRYTCVF